MNGWRICLCGILVLTAQAHAATLLKTILAGSETDLPSDTPSGRLDTAGEFGFVGALAISNGSGNYRGSAVALSRDWVLPPCDPAGQPLDELPFAGDLRLVLQADRQASLVAEVVVEPMSAGM